MTWVRNDDQAPINRKVAPLSDSAYRLWEEAKCWASRNGTDGRIAEDEIGTISVSPTIQRALARNVDELLRRRLWHRAEDPACPSEHCTPAGPDGWVIHDYLDYNPSAAEVAADRKAKRDRTTRWRESKRGRNAPRDASHAASQPASRDASHPPSRDASQDAPVTLPPTPSRPAPKEGGGGAPAASTARRVAAERAAGGRKEDQTPEPLPPPPTNGPAADQAKTAIRSALATSRAKARREKRPADPLAQLRAATPDVAPLVEPTAVEPAAPDAVPDDPASAA